MAEADGTGPLRAPLPGAMPNRLPENAPAPDFDPKAVAKDLLRASRLPLLPRDNLHVAGDLKKIRKGKALSPVLLVRGNAATGAAMTVADGYHRVCASWYKDENIPIACRIVSLPR